MKWKQSHSKEIEDIEELKYMKHKAYTTERKKQRNPQLRLGISVFHPSANQASIASDIGRDQGDMVQMYLGTLILLSKQLNIWDKKSERI